MDERTSIQVTELLEENEHLKTQLEKDVQYYKNTMTNLLKNIVDLQNQILVKDHTIEKLKLEIDVLRT